MNHSHVPTLARLPRRESNREVIANFTVQTSKNQDEIRGRTVGYPSNVPLFASVGRNDFIKIYKSAALLLPNILPRLGHQPKKKKKKNGILEDKSQLHDNP